jgi:CRISPR-associated protein Cas8b1/Cst1 subtype I-B
MQHISTHITGPESRKKERVTERGEMLKFFLEKINRTREEDGWPPMTMARMGKTLEGIPTKDLYYLKSVCDQASNFSKKFWWEINPKNHTEEKIREREAYQKFGEVMKSPRPSRRLPPKKKVSQPTLRTRD